MMKNTKCKHCIEGVVLSPDCKRIVANRWCELDEWDEETHCAPGGCHYYARQTSRNQKPETRNEEP